MAAPLHSDTTVAVRPWYALLVGKNPTRRRLGRRSLLMQQRGIAFEPFVTGHSWSSSFFGLALTFARTSARPVLVGEANAVDAAFFVVSPPPLPYALSECWGIAVVVWRSLQALSLEPRRGLVWYSVHMR